MSKFIRGTGNGLTPLQHSMDIFKQYILTNYFSTLTGMRGSGKPIIIDSKSFKGRETGDVCRYHFIPQFYGRGIVGQNASIRGNENTLQEFSMDLRMDQKAQAFVKQGKMTDIRTIWNFRDEAKSQLTEWWRHETEIDLVEALSGFNTDGATWIEGEAAKTHDAVTGDHRCLRVDYNSTKFETVEVSAANSDANSLLSAMTTSDVMNTQILDVLQDFAKTADAKYAMKPIRAKDGEEYYMLVLHPKAAISLRQDDRWEKRTLASLTGRGTLSDDPIATGAMGVWGHIIIKEANFVKTHSNNAGTLKIARNLLLGADAAILAYGQTLDWKEEKQDYDRIFGVAADEIRGVRKLTFDGCDLNVAQVPCAI